MRSRPSFRILAGILLLLLPLAMSSAAENLRLIPLSEPVLWQKMEFRVEGVPPVANPFDPEEVDLELEIRCPSGRRLTIPGFALQDYRRTLEGGRERLDQVGSLEWRVRWTPEEPGRHDLSLSVEVSGGALPSPALKPLEVPEEIVSGRHGWARVAADRRYFETSDGQPLRLIGENVCWAGGRGTFDYDDWFAAMAASGQNYARLWLSPWSIGLEHTPGTLNHYNQKGAWMLDYVFALAERHGLYLMVCFDHHGMFQTDDQGWGGTNNFWDSHNPYSATLGGPCEHPNEFFTDPAAFALYEKKLRYLVARYGYSPFLHSWQFFNEVDNLYRQQGMVGDDIVSWHERMAARLKALDPVGHLVTTSLTGGSERAAYWEIEDIDFSMYHSYFDPAPGRKVAVLAESFVRRFGKPFMVGEYGTSAYRLNLEEDPYLRGFRQLLWGGALGGSVGSSLTWWWESIHEEDVYPLYGTMSRLLDAVDWQKGAWSPIPFSSSAAPLGLVDAGESAEPFSADLALNDFRRIVLGNEVAVPHSLAATRTAEALQTYLRPEASPDCRPMRIHLWAEPGASLILEVDSVAGEASVEVRSGDELLLAESFAGPEEGNALPRAVNRELRVSLPTGLQRVDIINPGADWLRLSRLRLEGLRRVAFAGDWEFAPEVVGLRAEDRAALYVTSPHVVYPAGARRFNPPAVQGAAIEVPGMPYGRYRVRWLDPVDGRTLRTEEVDHQGELRLALPSFNADLVGLLHRVPSTRDGSGS